MSFYRRKLQNEKAVWELSDINKEHLGDSPDEVCAGNAHVSPVTSTGSFMDSTPSRAAEGASVSPKWNHHDVSLDPFGSLLSLGVPDQANVTSASQEVKDPKTNTSFPASPLLVEHGFSLQPYVPASLYELKTSAVPDDPYAALRFAFVDIKGCDVLNYQFLTFAGRGQGSRRQCQTKRQRHQSCARCRRPIDGSHDNTSATSRLSSYTEFAAVREMGSSVSFRAKSDFRGLSRAQQYVSL